MAAPASLPARRTHVHHELAKHFKPEEIGHMCCLGRCHENSAFNVGGLNYSGKAIDQLDDLLNEVRDGRTERTVPAGWTTITWARSMAQPILTAPMPSAGGILRAVGTGAEGDPVRCAERDQDRDDPRAWRCGIPHGFQTAGLPAMRRTPRAMAHRASTSCATPMKVIPRHSAIATCWSNDRTWYCWA